ncbi:L,D-transpeptidase family protein [Kaarinaea lacus]
MNTYIAKLIAVVFVSSIPFSPSALAQRTNDSLKQAIQEQLATVEDIELPKELDQQWRNLRRFYSRRQFQSVWFDEMGLNTRAQIWLNTIEAADSHGLDPADYQLGFFQRHRGDEPVSLRVWIELQLTKALLLYIKHMQTGRLSPKDMNLDWHIAKRSVDNVARLQRILKATDFEEALDSLQPTHDGYQRLRTALSSYLALQAAGGWPTIPDGPTLQIGDTDEQVALLRHRLQAEGDLEIERVTGKLEFDEMVKEAVEHFQVRYGIDVDGIVGPETRAAMNVPIAERIQQIQYNMERWRWLPRDLGDHYILVNTAGYELIAYENNQPVFILRIIAGTPDRSTPAVAGPLESIIFNPYWYIPRSIALNDILPLQQRNPGYLARMGIHVFKNSQTALTEVPVERINWKKLNEDNFPYQLRQDPGPRNSLGSIKFKFANDYALYLHDTPKKRLFDQETRAFSSGCIRVETAIDLADYLLKNQKDWTKQKIQETIDSGETVVVELQKPIPLYLVYWTAWVGSDEQVYFRKDIYGWDQSQSECK